MHLILSGVSTLLRAAYLHDYLPEDLATASGPLQSSWQAVIQSMISLSSPTYAVECPIMFLVSASTLPQFPRQRQILQSPQHALHRHGADTIGAVQHDAALSFYISYLSWSRLSDYD